MKQFINLDNARGDNQRDVMKQIEKDNVCPFCPNNLKKYHKKPIIFENNCWFVTENQWPYVGSSNHFLLILKRHLVDITEIAHDEWGEIREIVRKLSLENGLEAGSLLVRYGSTKNTGASVEHLHIHLVSTDKDSANYEPVVTRIG